MKQVRQLLCSTYLVALLIFFAAGIAVPIPVAYASDCIANNNLSEVADHFISRCRKASIRREFPGELLSASLSTIKHGKSSQHKKAWKLLNDKRFDKGEYGDGSVLANDKPRR